MDDFEQRLRRLVEPTGGDAPLVRELDAQIRILSNILESLGASQGGTSPQPDIIDFDDDPQPELLSDPAAYAAETASGGGPNLAWLARAVPSGPELDGACALLASTSDDAAIAEGLVDLFGFERIELVEEVLGRRAALQAEWRKGASDAVPLGAAAAQQAYPIRDVPRQAASQQHAAVASTSAGPAPHLPSAQISIRSASEKQQLKQAAKEARRLNRQLHGKHAAEERADGGLEWTMEEMMRMRQEELRAAGQRPIASGEGRVEEDPMLNNPHIFSSTLGGTNSSGLGTRYALPEGTTRREAEVYQEVIVPATGKVAMRAGETLIKISDLDPVARGSFPGYSTLNRLQSIIFPIAYKTNENMLVCAPTGAGKTDVAMLTILRAIAVYGVPRPVGPLAPNAPNAPNAPPRRGGEAGWKLSKRGFKVVYVAPMKALAAEVVRKMGKRLGWLGFVVRELTGDMQLTKSEIAETHLIVTTPEKWDVVTRKPGEDDLVSKVKLLIIDEVHLLHEDRGAVIESIVARTLRQVESSQSLIRIVGLSATLPNYVDVSDFLRVNRMQGLFYFDASFRPVPLEQHFIGVKGKAGSQISKSNLDEAAFEKVAELVGEGHQVMVFVHARKETVGTAEILREKARAEEILGLFDPSEHPRFQLFKMEVGQSRNREMKELFQAGFGIHHAGMLRSDRSLSERMFEAGITRVLCCTATLAWGVNLPAYAVVIKGTQIYDAAKGSFVDLGILDVLQIFGRAGRPQYEDRGVGYICTSHDKLDHYISAITQQHPIESKFVDGIVDSLNAEIALGTVETVDEGVQWIGWTYLFVRMRKNPMVYGINAAEVQDDPYLGSKRRSLIQIAARRLVAVGMITYDESTGAFASTELGRIASKYYIRNASIDIFNGTFRPKMSEADVLAMLSSSVEFDQIKVRDSETQELEHLMGRAPCQVRGGAVTTHGKVNILLQGYISRAFVEDFALVSDTAYVAQNAARIVRALVEIGISRRWAQTAAVLVEMSKSIERRLWSFAHPLAQSGLPPDILYNLERWAEDVPIEDLAAMSPADAGKLIHLNERFGTMLVKAAKQFPVLSITHALQPLSSDLLRIRIQVRQDFDWSQRDHGPGEPFWMWIEDGSGETILRLARLFVRQNMPNFSQDLVLPAAALPPELNIRIMSDRWVGSDYVTEVPLEGFTMPLSGPPPTELLDLPMLDTNDINDPVLHHALGGKPSLFPAETQCFHSLFHTPGNTLLCVSEPAVLETAAKVALRRCQLFPTSCAVVVVVGKSRLGPISSSLGAAFQQTTVRVLSLLDRGKKPRLGASHNIFVTTQYALTDLAGELAPDLVVLFDLQSLDAEYELAIAGSLRKWRRARVLGLSASLLDSSGVAGWLGVEPEQVYNFAPRVRADALTMTFRAFDLTATGGGTKPMIKPLWSVVLSAPSSVIIFVPLRGQPRAVARELLRQSAATMDPSALARSEELLAPYARRFRDADLADALLHGIVTLRESMSPRDQRLALELFTAGAVKILIAPHEASSFLQVRAQTVVAMGTQYTTGEKEGAQTVHHYDAKALAHMSNFAKPDGDQPANFIVMCHSEQIELYSKFLHHGLPVESALFAAGSNKVHAAALTAMVSGEITSCAGLVHWLSWTYASQRIATNPFYYDLMPEQGRADAGALLSRLADRLVAELGEYGCLKASGANGLWPTAIGRLLVAEKLELTSIDRFRAMKLANALAFAKGAKRGTGSGLPGADQAEAFKAFHGRLPRYMREAIGAPQYDDPGSRTKTWLAAFHIRRSPAQDAWEAEQANVVGAALRALPA